jgi:hypothetical protein
MSIASSRILLEAVERVFKHREHQALLAAHTRPAAKRRIELGREAAHLARKARNDRSVILKSPPPQLGNFRHPTEDPDNEPNEKTRARGRRTLIDGLCGITSLCPTALRRRSKLLIAVDPGLLLAAEHRFLEALGDREANLLACGIFTGSPVCGLRPMRACSAPCETSQIRNLDRLALLDRTTTVEPAPPSTPPPAASSPHPSSPTAPPAAISS